MKQRSEGIGLRARKALGGLLPLLDDAAVRDILVQVRCGSGRLWVDRGAGPALVTGWSVEPAAVAGLARELIAAGGRHIDELHPCTDVRLGDGVRVHAVLPPIAVEGAAVSIRVPRLETIGLTEMQGRGFCDARMAGWLRGAVRRRLNLLITGGTGSGKTTLLGALLELAPREERIITIEDVAELRIRHPHVVALQSRQANSEGVGEVPLERLLRESLRMRPDRIVLGECRGVEVVTLLAALNTGHDGGAGTLHASRMVDVPARLEALGALAGLEPAALARQAVAALHAVVHVERGPSGHRIAAVGRPVLGQRGRLGVEAVSP